jgi:fibro-slime domain-containing protein
MAKFGAALVVAVGLTVLPVATASADQLSVTYFTVTTPDPDFNTTPSSSFGTFNNEVQPTLANGLPVYNAAYGGPTLHDVVNGNLTWWSPTLNPHVVQTSTSVVNVPFANDNFFAPNGTGPNNANGQFQTALFSGVLTVPTAEHVTFNFGADDDAFIVIDNNVVAQLGGVHGFTLGPVTTASLTQGNHSIEIFYADREVTQAQLEFSIVTDGVTTSVPEPSTWAMMILGFFGVGFMAYRRRNGAAFRLA